MLSGSDRECVDADEGAVHWNGRVEQVPVHRPWPVRIENAHYPYVGQARFLSPPGGASRVAISNRNPVLACTLVLARFPSLMRLSAPGYPTALLY